ncbi:YicC/YloC family endoribonuclease [Legionella oakridgensis]|uniref:TIGR00255 family protein n=2 Tax=Legionella oakridgensis TaxID=29423 RepID=W0BDE9_9GAMM|nr:YicC/YloC family endoribonuclease [Legionella oakridgensis]AHE66429.1 hypothetical protein Loa_00861 [Legionella oakridgensis ATCC 33761 = DSM 21215]ETO93783.1 hypothetical protein LOR_72c20490 [Legionella oakridgensis RV-2-2007]KTD36868.1 putative stress-induced protein [Legionella oakridgensis]STY19605.1 putative stress-induced protein [Legionella longbeachae]
MTHSMTAFSRAQNQVGSTMICWELKSVNHRYLEASFRLPESFRFLEADLRQQLRGQISRGKLECLLKLSDAATEQQNVVINEGLMKALLGVGEKLSMEQQLANDLTVGWILSWPGVVQLSQPETETLHQHIEYLFQEALQQFLEARATEGEGLRNFIKTRLSMLNDEIKQTRELVESLPSQTREKLLSRLQGLQLDVSESRFEQEIALMLTRLDVSEELDRLQIHVDEVARVLQSGEAVGRRLDFLMQELNREANTLGSKSDSAALTQHAVEMKVLIEQMREQIQNIE